MILARQLISWRSHRGFTQVDFAKRAGITPAYLSRLEAAKADPSLSILYQLASALDISVGTLLEGIPPQVKMDNHELDQLARAVYHPSAKENRDLPYVQVLARAYEDRRIALGLHRPRSRKNVDIKASPPGQFALRRVRAILGEENWKLLLARIDKHAIPKVDA